MATTLPVLGLSFSYTADSGDTFPTAFVYPQQVTYDNASLCAGITAVVFSSQAHFEAGEQPVGTHNTQVPQSVYLAQGAQMGPFGTSTTTLANLNAETWLQLMQQTLDVQDGVNADGTPKMVAFYANSTIVSANKTIS